MKVISIHPLEFPKGNERASNIHRNLKSSTYYYLYTGVKIEEKRITIENSSPATLYNPTRYVEHDCVNNVQVDICAIVGQNGAGKSSLIDLMLRIVNNVATCVIGEEYRFNKAAHLHFIPDVYGEVFYLINDYILCLQCKGSSICVQPYQKNNRTGEFEQIPQSLPIATKDNKSIEMGWNEIMNNDSINARKSYLEDWLRIFCYNVVLNYSLHSFNPTNYRGESTSQEKENEIRTIDRENGLSVESWTNLKKRAIDNGMPEIVDEACSWVSGIFHKNDGYMTPLVLTPFRSCGNININSENKLSEERLFSLLFLKDKQDKLSFDTINGKIKVAGFKTILDEYNIEQYANVNIRIHGYAHLKGDLLTTVNNYVKECFKRLYSLEDLKHESKYETQSWNYILTKFYKISYTYPRYHNVFRVLKTIKEQLVENEKNEIKQAIYRMSTEHSHITMKLMRALNYLKHHHIDVNKEYSVQQYSDEINRLANKQNFPKYQIHIGEFLPPPIMKIELIVVDKNDITQTRIPFNNLSSGEKQICYTLSSVFYHLANLDTVGQYPSLIYETQSQEEGKEKKPIRYNHVNIVLDEMELYFHPEMQRQFINLFLEGLKQLPLYQIMSIHVMIVTHSPFVLSDIPRCNILFMQKNGEPAYEGQMVTFGSNIHSMLKHSFFLENGTMGDFALQTVKDVINRINFCTLFVKRLQSKEIFIKEDDKMLLSLPEDMRRTVNQSFDELQQKWKLYYDYDYLRSVVSLIQEPILRNKLEDEINYLQENL